MNTFVYCFLLSNLGVLSYGFIIQTHISQDEEVQLQAGITVITCRREIRDAEALIEAAVDFDMCQETRGGGSNIMRLKDIRDYRNSKEVWASSMRLDNQGDINVDGFRFARIALQTGGQTNAQANVQIGVRFGSEAIQNALKESLTTGEVVWLRNNHVAVEGYQYNSMDAGEKGEKSEEEDQFEDSYENTNNIF